MSQSANTPPVFSLSLGRCRVAVWAYQSDASRPPFYKSKLTESYKDQAGAWQETSNFSEGELGNVIALADAARSFVLKAKFRDQARRPAPASRTAGPAEAPPLAPPMDGDDNIPF